MPAFLVPVGTPRGGPDPSARFAASGGGSPRRPSRRHNAPHAARRILPRRHPPNAVCAIGSFFFHIHCVRSLSGASAIAARLALARPFWKNAKTEAKVKKGKPLKLERGR